MDDEMMEFENLDSEYASNTFLSPDIKRNIDTLVKLLTTFYPDYDYSNYQNILASLKIVDDPTLPSYKYYDKNSNTLSLNIDRCENDRVDYQHLVFAELLRIGSKVYDSPEELYELNTGISETLALTMNPDDGMDVDNGMKKLDAVEYQEVYYLTKVVDSTSILESFMKQDFSILVSELEKNGIPNEDFVSFINAMNSGANSFAKSEEIVTDMYGKKIATQVKNGEIDHETAARKFDSFKASLITSKAELMTIYPHYDFSYVNGFDLLKNTVNTVENNVKSLTPREYTSRLLQ